GQRAADVGIAEGERAAAGYGDVSAGERQRIPEHVVSVVRGDVVRLEPGRARQHVDAAGLQDVTGRHETEVAAGDVNAGENDVVRFLEVGAVAGGKHQFFRGDVHRVAGGAYTLAGSEPQHAARQQAAALDGTAAADIDAKRADVAIKPHVTACSETGVAGDADVRRTDADAFPGDEFQRTGLDRGVAGNRTAGLHAELACGDLAAVDDVAAHADQEHPPVLGDDIAGRDDALVVDHLREHVVGDLRAQQHLAAGRADAAGIRDGGGARIEVFRHRARNRELQKPVTIEVDGDLAARREIHAAEFRDDDAASVLHRAAEKTDVARRLQQALVQDEAAGGAARIAEHPVVR